MYRISRDRAAAVSLSSAGPLRQPAGMEARATAPKGWMVAAAGACADTFVFWWLTRRRWTCKASTRRSRLPGRRELGEVGLVDLGVLKGLATALKDGDTTIERAFPKVAQPAEEAATGKGVEGLEARIGGER